jgi:hypothetical protein
MLWNLPCGGQKVGCKTLAGKTFVGDETPARLREQRCLHLPHGCEVRITLWHLQTQPSIDVTDSITSKNR